MLRINIKNSIGLLCYLQVTHCHPRKAAKPVPLIAIGERLEELDAKGEKVAVEKVAE